MCELLFRTLLIFFIGAAEISTGIGEATKIPDSNDVQIVKEYHDHNDTSFAYRYYFEDGSIVSQAGTFKNVSIPSDTPINTDGNEYVRLYGFGKGFIRFIIRRKIYEFNYDIDEDSASGVLTVVSPNGTVIDETFNQTTDKAYWYLAGLFRPDYRQAMIPFNEYFFFASDFLTVNMVLRFPSTINHVAFGCEFTANTQFNIAQFLCKTYENSTLTEVAFTTNVADPAWIEEHKNQPIETPDHENPRS